VTGYRHSAAPARRRRLWFRRTGVLAGLAQTVAAEQKYLGVLDQAVGNRSRDGGVEEDVAPVGKRYVRGNDRRSLLSMARGDDLIKEIRSLLVESQISQLVTDEQCWLGINSDVILLCIAFAPERSLACNSVILTGSGRQSFLLVPS
jgi:hypothetical protein